jgi:hypothetical protein
MLDREKAMRNEEITWDKVFSAWERVCKEICPNVLNNNLFKEIKIVPNKEPRLGVADNVVDWWSTDQVNTNIKDLNVNGSSANLIWYPTKTGVVNTAEMLWKYKEDNGNIALIFIMAFMNYCEDSLLGKWHKKGHIIYDEMYKIVSDEMKDRNIYYYWHGKTKYFIPWTIEKDIYKEPSDIYDFMQIICLDILLSTTKYTLIHITKDV